MKWAAASGKRPQAFLDAAWVSWLLRRIPAEQQRKWALRLLSLSPHYFFSPPRPGEAVLSFDQHLEREAARWADSRTRICDYLLQSHLDREAVVVDYGCGPGFLTKVVARRVGRVFGCDISTGALACARVLNSSAGTEYVLASPDGMRVIHDGSVDVVFSIALVQHVTDEELEHILRLCWCKLKRGGKLILHLQIEDEIWRSESHWRVQRSLRGRIRYRYGLHCFGRDESEVKELVSRCGFDQVEIRPISDWVDDDFDDICRQHVLAAVRS